MILYEKKQSYSTRMSCEVRALGNRQYRLNSLKTVEPNRSHSIEVYPKVKRREKKNKRKTRRIQQQKWDNAVKEPSQKIAAGGRRGAAGGFSGRDACMLRR